ncbi:MAG: hypothetical protein R2734_16455 [Nocardioides sp.]
MGVRPVGARTWNTRRLANYRGASAATSPTLEYDGAGVLTVAWAVYGDRTFVAERHTRAGGKWSRVRHVAEHEGGGYEAVDLAVNAAGDAVLGWRGPSLQKIQVIRRVDGVWGPAVSWNHGLLVDVAIGADGTAAALVTRTDNGDSSLHISRSLAGGDWSRLAPVGTRPTDEVLDATGLVVDAAGTVTAAWRELAIGQRRWQIRSVRAQLGDRGRLRPACSGTPARSMAPSWSSSATAAWWRWLSTTPAG